MCGYALLIVSHYAMCRKDRLHTFALGFCISRKDGTGGGEWGLQGAVHMVAARLGCERAIVVTGRATSCADCMDRLRKHYSYFSWDWFLARKAAWALIGCITTDNADYCVFVNE